MPEANEAANPSLVDNPLAPDIFADGVAGLFLMNGALRVSFAAARVNHATNPGALSRAIVGRLAIPIETAETMAHEILKFIDAARGEGGPPPRLPRARPRRSN